MIRTRKILLSNVVLAFGLASTVRAQAPRDHLVEGFRNPPKSARPQVWWHWMNGNVSEEGARLDLEWLHRIGIGGVQLFEAGLEAPTVVPHRLVYMSPAWKSALRASVASASRLGLDFTIAASPGWSASGGPWVTPRNAMKKLVWSETSVSGGRSFHGVLRAPPSVSGPYQDVPLSAVEAGAAEGPAAYRDARVIAYPATEESRPSQVRISSSAGSVDAALLSDGLWGKTMVLPYTAKDRSAWLSYDFGTARKLGSVSLGLPGLRGFGAPKAPTAFLEVSDDGERFRAVVTLPPSFSPVRSASFRAITSRWWRVRLAPDLTPSFMDKLRPAPGAIPPQFGPPPPMQYAVSEVRFDSEPRVSDGAEKAGFATLPDYYAAETPSARGVDASQVVDLTSRMKSDGTLDWTPPKGRWTVLRMGWSLTGHRNGPAPVEATGLEVDKLDPARVTAYARHYLALYENVLGPLRQAGVTGLLSDSIEAGPQNWTESLPDEFARRRGYDPTPWLPALTGMIVQDSARTDRFLWDWRKTISDLYADAHYATLKAAAAEHGLSYFAEALEDHRPQLGDDKAMRVPADVPMGAMWLLPPDGEPNPTYVADIKGAASVANLYGKPVVAAESLTAFGQPWAFAPADLKATADLEMALGVNRLMIHESAHQPLVGSAPGLALAPFLGQYFNRNETWASMAEAWISYLARSSFLLQQGHHCADVAYFYGEEAPVTSLYGDEAPTDIPAGHDFDFVNADAMTSRLRVVDGTLQTPDGVKYRLLKLGGSSRFMTLATLRRVKELLQDGATVVGKRPIGSPSLADDDGQVRAQIDELWGRSNTTAIRTFGKGKLFPNDDTSAAFATLGLQRDWLWTGAAEAKLAVLHRVLDDGDFYYVVNRRSRREKGEMTLRVAGRLPEVWHADTGAIEPTSYRITGGITSVSMDLAPGEAIFIVMRRPATARFASVAPSYPRELARLDTGWRIEFQPGRGAPEDERPARLESWTRSTESGIRYFSGVATYSRTVTLAARPLNQAKRLILDLGVVSDIAEVHVNGVSAGIVWKAPFQVDATRLLKRGRNQITIRVASLWVNRLIGDAQPGAKPIAVTTGPTYAADAPLKQSGLIGPVKIIGCGK